MTNREGCDSVDFDTARLSRESSFVPSKAVFRKEPFRRRVFRCCWITADIALAPAVVSLAENGVTAGASIAVSGSIVEAPVCDCADCGLDRKKESFESKDPERLLLWPLLTLPVRARPDCSLTGRVSTLLVVPLSIGETESQSTPASAAGKVVLWHWELVE